MKNLKIYLTEDENKFFKNLGIGSIKLIKDWLNEHDIIKYKINNDLTIKIEQHLHFENYKDEELPNYIQFSETTYNVTLSSCAFRNLNGFPKKCQSLWIDDCYNLETLEGTIEYCHDLEISNRNLLKDLKGCPEVKVECILKNLSNLKSLKGFKYNKQLLNFKCYNCPELTSLEYSPNECYKYDIDLCKKIKSLKGFPKIINSETRVTRCGKKFTKEDIREICKVPSDDMFTTIRV